MMLIPENLRSRAKHASPIRIGMLLLPDFNSMATLAFIDPLRAANYIHGEALFHWDFLSLHGEPVTASNALSISQTQSLYQADTDFDMVVVNSSWAPERFHSKQLQTWLYRASKSGTVLVGLDTGAFVLASAGLMKQNQSVVHYEHTDSFRELFGDTKVNQQLFIIDNNRISCCGGLAAADLAVEIIRGLYGIDLANGAAHYIFLERSRAGDEQQLPRQHEPVGYSVPASLREAILLMERNLEEPLRISDISQYLKISQRQLERLFRRYTSLTPKRYYLNVRLDRARGLATQTELSIAEISIACGFGSSEQFIRAYKIQFGITPGKDKVKGRIPFSYRSLPKYSSI